MTKKLKTDAFSSKSKIGDRLKTARERAKLTQQKLADTADIARTSIVHYEQGNVVPGSMELIRLANALNISPNYILSGSDEYFSSNPMEQIIAASDDTARIAIFTICMKILDREISEGISNLILSLVKAKLNKTEYQEFEKNILLVADAMSQRGDEFEQLAERIIEKGNFPDSKKKTSAKKKSTKKKHGK